MSSKKTALFAKNTIKKCSFREKTQITLQNSKLPLKIKKKRNKSRTEKQTKQKQRKYNSTQLTTILGTAVRE